MNSPPLMQHQEEGIAFLLGRKSGLLAFEQGLGKTRVAIEAFARLHDAGDVECLVVLCPNSLKRNWSVEVSKYASGLSVLIIEGSVQQRRRLLGGATEAVVVIGYESGRQDITAVRALLGRRPSVLVLDESHYVKNQSSLTSTAAAHFAPMVKYRWLLTGTPVTNSPSDIYSQIAVAEAGSPFGSQNAFMARYGDADNHARRSELATRIAPFMLRRTKEQCLDLPAKSFVDIQVELAPWQRALYDAVRDQVVGEVEGMSPEQFRSFAPTALTRLLRLSQLASNPRLVFDSERREPAKFSELDRLVTELVEQGGRKVIIWSYYVQTIKLLSERFSHVGAVTLFGGTPAGERQDVAQQFQEDPETRLLIANPAAAGTGFTLTSATFAIYETLTWRYDFYAQSQDRNHRIGQGLPVTYLRLLAADTVELAIAETLERKTQLARSLVGDGHSELRIESLAPSQFIALVRGGRLPA